MLQGKVCVATELTPPSMPLASAAQDNERHVVSYSGEAPRSVVSPCASVPHGSLKDRPKVARCKGPPSPGTMLKCPFLRSVSHPAAFDLQRCRYQDMPFPACHCALSRVLAPQTSNVKAGSYCGKSAMRPKHLVTASAKFIQFEG